MNYTKTILQKLTILSFIWVVLVLYLDGAKSYSSVLTMMVFLLIWITTEAEKVYYDSKVKILLISEIYEAKHYPFVSDYFRWSRFIPAFIFVTFWISAVWNPIEQMIYMETRTSYTESLFLTLISFLLTFYVEMIVIHENIKRDLENATKELESRVSKIQQK